MSVLRLGAAAGSRVHNRREVVHIVGREEASSARGGDAPTPPVLVLLPQHFDHIAAVEGELLRLRRREVESRYHPLHQLTLGVTSTHAHHLNNTKRWNLILPPPRKS